MKKRDKSKKFIMGQPIQLMPKRKQKILGKKKNTPPPVNSHWHDRYIENERKIHPMTPTESYRIDIIDLSDPHPYKELKTPSGIKVRLELNFNEINEQELIMAKERELMFGKKEAVMGNKRTLDI
jgi:hypothetical protein